MIKQVVISNVGKYKHIFLRNFILQMYQVSKSEIISLLLYIAQNIIFFKQKGICTQPKRTATKMFILHFILTTYICTLPSHMLQVA